MFKKKKVVVLHEGVLTASVPLGQGNVMAKRLASLLLGFLRRPEYKVLVESDVVGNKDIVRFRLRLGLIQFIGLQKRVVMFKTIVSKTLDNKLINKGLKKMASDPDDLFVLREMLLNGTDLTLERLD